MKEQLEQLKKEAQKIKNELDKELQIKAQNQREENQKLDAAQRRAQMMDELKAGNFTKNRSGHEITHNQLVLENAEQTLKEDVHSYVDNRSAMMGLIKSFAELNASLDHEFRVRFQPGFHEVVELFYSKASSTILDVIDPPAEVVLPELVYAVSVDKDKAIHCADLLDANGVALESGPIEGKDAKKLNDLFRGYVTTWLVEEKGYAVDPNDPTVFNPIDPDNALTQEALSKELKTFLASPEAANALKFSERPSPRPR